MAPPANDNGVPDGRDQTLHAALRQFAQHGIGAAAHARNQAERAFFSGDHDTYQWWRGISRTRDRRLAETLVNKTNNKKTKKTQNQPTTRATFSR